MLRESPAASGAFASSKRRPAAHARGLYAFRNVEAAERELVPLPDRRISLADVHALIVDVTTRLAGEVIAHPDPRKGAKGQTYKIRAYRAHGATTALQLYEHLWWLATDGASDHSRGYQPRTGGLMLIRSWAPAMGWPTTRADGTPLSDSALYDAHKNTLWRARELLAVAGVLTWEVAQDELLQDRATDWRLLSPTVSPEALALGALVADRYRDRHPVLERARPGSARVRAERFRRFRDRCRRHMTPLSYAKRFESAPLPTGQPCGATTRDPSGSGKSSDRASGRAGIEGLTRRPADPSPASPPRAKPVRGHFSEGEGARAAEVGPVAPASPRHRSEEQRDPQRDHDRQLGYVVAHRVEALGGEAFPVSGRAAGRLGRLAALARTRVGYDVDQLAAALTRIQTQGRLQPLTLAQAAAQIRRDLRHHPAIPGAQQRQTRRKAADERRAEQLQAIAPPPWMRQHGGRVLALDGHAQQPWILCTALPADLDTPAVRLTVHAGAHHAGISPSRRAETSADKTRNGGAPEHAYAAAQHGRGDGAVRLVALDGSCAVVPPETSDATTIRWRVETATTDGQRRAWTALRARLAGPPGDTRLAPRVPLELPDDFHGAWRTIHDAITELWPTQNLGHPSPPPHQTPAESAEIQRGRQLIAQHGSRTAALRATHPDRGGDAEDLMAVLAVPEDPESV